MSIPCGVCAPVQKISNIQRNKSGYRKNIKTVMPTKRSRNNRGRIVSRPYPYVDKHTTQIQFIANNGIFKGKE